MKPFEIFRTGTHQPLKGDAIAFSDGDLSAIASAYDPAKHHAPIVVGHPKLDAPAYGWIDGLAVKGDRLVATPGDVDPAFADMVREGKFRKVSAAFFPSDAPNNPTPGQRHLRHVGFLGAQPPAVKGLKPIEFGDDDDIIVIEFADVSAAWGLTSAGRLFRRLRDWIIADKGLETADVVLPEWDVQALSDAATEARQPSDPVFSDSETQDPTMTTKTPAEAAMLEQREAALAAREAAFAEREQAAATAAAEAARTARATEDAAYVDGVVQQGRLPDGLKPLAVALFADLGDDTISFADGDATRELTPREAFRDLLAKLPQPVKPGELAADPDAAAINFADQDAVGVAIEIEIRKAAENGETITPADALDRVRSGVRK